MGTDSMVVRAWSGMGTGGRRGHGENRGDICNTLKNKDLKNKGENKI